jgi:nicotine oxidoreductase
MMWVIEGDIKGAYDNINHKTLLNILRERIDDWKFILLIKKSLEAGYMEFRGPLIKPEIDTPQGSIVSPILANIYFDKLDKFILRFKKEYTKPTGIKEEITREYKDLINAKHICNKGLATYSDYSEKKAIFKELKNINLQMTTTKRVVSKTTRLRLSYLRYADDWIIAINGPK